MVRRGATILMAHELLRQAALILAAGWMKNENAGDDAGRIIPLWSGAARADWGNDPMAPTQHW